MKRRIRILSMAVCVMLLSASFSGCKGSSKNAESNKLTYWMGMAANVSSQFTDFGETEIAKELEKRLDVDIEYIHPASGQQSEKFNVMIAQSDLPDMIEYTWTSYPGGPQKALDQGKIIDIAEYLDKTPNFKKYLEEHEDIVKLVKTDNGSIIGFPLVREDEMLLTSAGISVRKDWLDELGLEVPQTIDEWETVLRAFKDKKGATAPLSILPIQQFPYGAFVGAFGTTATTYVEDGIVKYGPAQPEYKDFLALMSKWYNEGLLDASIATQDYKGMDANILDGTSGAIVGSLGGGMGKWLAAATEPGYDLVGAPYPTLTKGETPKFGHRDLLVPGTFVCISSSCDNIDLALKYLDYGYSEEGKLLYNFGIEGESYTMENGYPTYTDVIANNAEGKSMAESMSKYIRAHTGGPFIQDERYMEQYAALPQQKDALEKWAATDASKYVLPHIYLEDSTEIAKLQTSVDTYYTEMLMKFIMGIEPIDNFDKYVSELNARGLDKILAAQQAAYNRYLER